MHGQGPVRVCAAAESALCECTCRQKFVNAQGLRAIRSFVCTTTRQGPSACTYICAAVVCSAGERLGLWRVRASHRNPYSFSFFFLCPSLLAEQYAIAVEKQNRPMNFSEAFIVMHGHSRRGCSINYRLFYCVILVIDISCILAITGIFYALISWNTHMKKMFYWYFIKSWKDYLFSRYSIISFSSM